MKITVLFMVFGLFGCAAMQKDFLDRSCNFDGAYSLGNNDAQKNQPMNSGVLNECPETGKSEAMRGYREGYNAFLASRPAQINVNISNGPISGAKWECKEAYGRKECGYDCKEAYGKIVCGKRPTDNCVVAYGSIRCGKNCREDYGRIKCED